MTNNVPNDGGDVTESIRSGAYFEQARSWYSVLFSNPVVERNYFFVALSIASLTLIISFLALGVILPVRETYPFVAHNSNMDGTVLRMERLRTGRQDSPDEALMRFFAKSYVKMRESFSQDKATVYEQFVANYSDPMALQSYLQAMDVSNPSSPKLLFRDAWTRRVAEARSVTLNLKREPYQALVRFDVSAVGVDMGRPVSYTADIRFSYSPLQAVEELDSVTGETVSRFTKPKFQVVSYNVQPSAAP